MLSCQPEVPWEKVEAHQGLLDAVSSSSVLTLRMWVGGGGRGVLPEGRKWQEPRQARRESTSDFF